MSKARIFLVGLGVLAALAVIAAGAYWYSRAGAGGAPGETALREAEGAEQEEPALAAPQGCVLDAGSVGGPIDLIDENAQRVTEDHFSEGPTLIYFGYTYCPDVCPLALQMEKQALEALGQDGGMIQPVMISLDPARDTPEQMGKYVGSDAFPAGLVGLTGTEAQVSAAAKAFRVAWQKQDDPGSAAKYLIGHSSYLYLMDEEWRLKALFPTTFSPQDAAQCIRAGLQAPVSGENQ